MIYDVFRGTYKQDQNRYYIPIYRPSEYYAG